MNVPPKKASSLTSTSRSPHVERRHGATVHDDSAHLWAVSYSDFLMVLLCFFIIFFSTDEKNKQNVLQTILLTQQQLGSGQGTAIERSPATPTVRPAEKATLEGKSFSTKDIEKTLKNFSISKSDTSEGLMVHFQDDLYDRGSYQLPRQKTLVLKDFLTKLYPYREEISLTFIGHSDDTKIRPAKNKVFQNNFDLSAFRATRALQFAVAEGFAEEQLSAKGNSKNSRISRTLSVLIRARGTEL